MNYQDELKCIAGTYLAVEELDEYTSKEYVMKDVEDLAKKLMKNHNEEFSLNKFREIGESLSLKTRFQDALIILKRLDEPIEVTLLIKKRLKKLS